MTSLSGFARTLRSESPTFSEVLHQLARWAVKELLQKEEPLGVIRTGPEG